MWAKKFFWQRWRNKSDFYAPCPGFCDDPDQRRFRFNRWNRLGNQVSWRRGGCGRLYRLYWRTHPTQYAQMRAHMDAKWARIHKKKS
jgi:hypothetical protein